MENRQENNQNHNQQLPLRHNLLSNYHNSNLDQEEAELEDRVDTVLGPAPTPLQYSNMWATNTNSNSNSNANHGHSNTNGASGHHPMMYSQTSPSNPEFMYSYSALPGYDADGIQKPGYFQSPLKGHSV